MVRRQARIRAQKSVANSNASPFETTLDLSPSQLNSIKIEPVGTHLFPVEKEAVGSISFADDLSVQVYPSYQGKIIKSLVELGDEVKKDQPLYTIDSPDLIQAESTLIGAAATLELTSKELARARDLYTTNVGVSAKRVGAGYFRSTNCGGGSQSRARCRPRVRQVRRRNRSDHRFAQN